MVSLMVYKERTFVHINIQVTTADESKAISNAREGGKDNLFLPKVPARKLSSHKSVVQFKESKVEADDKDDLITNESRNSLSLNNNKKANLNRDTKSQKPSKRDNGYEGDERNNMFWRPKPLRDFF